MENIEIL